MKEEIKSRLKEPSTYAGVSLLFLLAGKHISPEILASGVSTILTAVSALGGILAVILKELKS